jgi:hypothetical protein
MRKKGIVSTTDGNSDFELNEQLLLRKIDSQSFDADSGSSDNGVKYCFIDRRNPTRESEAILALSIDIFKLMGESQAREFLLNRLIEMGNLMDEEN